MAYTTVALFLDPAWEKVHVFGMSLGGLTVGRVFRDALPYLVVWNDDGSLAQTAGPFDEVDSAALNDSGDIAAAVRPRDTVRDYPRLVWIRDGKVLKSFEDSFAPGIGVHVSAINRTGLVVGSAVPDHDERLIRAFSLQLPGDVVTFHDIPGGNRVRAVDVNDAGAILLTDPERTTQSSHIVEPGGSVRFLGIMTLSGFNRSGVAVGWFYEPLATIPMLYDTSADSPTFVSLTLPAGYTEGVATAINDAGLVVGYVWKSAHDFRGVLWQLIGHPAPGEPITYSVNFLEELAPPGPFSIAADIDSVGRILTNLGGVDDPPALLVPFRRAKAGVVGPLWELAVGEVNGEPVVGLKGVGVQVVLPNGQVITIPVIVLPPIGPGGSDPQKLWQLLGERERARLASSALSQIGGQLQDATSREILERASAELIQHANRKHRNG